MNSPFSQLALDETAPPRGQIERFVRDLIVSGKLPPRTRVPSTQELARTWQTPVPTVHAALARLVKDGLLVRHHGSGTYVRQREARLTRVGIYFYQDMQSTAEAPFLQAKLRALRVALNAKGIESDVWVDPRPRAQHGTPWPVLARAAKERRIQAIILPQASWDYLRWLSKLPVPIAHASSAGLPSTVHLDVEQLVELSLETLAQRGCRSVGVITTLWPRATDPTGERHDYYLFFEQVLTVAGKLGLTIRDEWIRAPRGALPDISAGEAFGYREFQNLWRQTRRPEGLLVFPHTASRGVIMGLLEAQVRVPQDLKLVLHKNAGVELFCPVPATFAVSDEAEVAAQLVELVEKQFRGEPVAAARWPVRIADHAGGATTPAGAAKLRTQKEGSRET